MIQELHDPDPDSGQSLNVTSNQTIEFWIFYYKMMQWISYEYFFLAHSNETIEFWEFYYKNDVMNFVSVFFYLTLHWKGFWVFMKRFVVKLAEWKSKGMWEPWIKEGQSAEG